MEAKKYPKMKKQNLTYAGKEELEILSDQLNPEELYVMGYLKGFNRTALKEWSRQGLMDFTVNQTN